MHDDIVSFDKGVAAAGLILYNETYRVASRSRESYSGAAAIGIVGHPSAKVPFIGAG
jgi:hypothetical protein